MKPNPGDVYIIKCSEGGGRGGDRLALYVQHGRGVTSDMECGLATGFVFIGNTKARGDFLTKPRALAPHKERLVRKASEQEQRAFRRKCASIAGSGKAVKR